MASRPRRSHGQVNCLRLGHHNPNSNLRPYLVLTGVVVGLCPFPLHCAAAMPFVMPAAAVGAMWSMLRAARRIHI